MKTQKYYKNLLERSIESTEGGNEGPLYSFPDYAPDPIWTMPDWRDRIKPTNVSTPEQAPRPIRNWWEDIPGWGTIPPEIREIIMNTPGGIRMIQNHTLMNAIYRLFTQQFGITNMNISTFIALLNSLYGQNFGQVVHSFGGPGGSTYYFFFGGRWYELQNGNLVQRSSNFTPPHPQNWDFNLPSTWNSPLPPWVYGIPLGMIGPEAIEQIINNPNYFPDLQNMFNNQFMSFFEDNSEELRALLFGGGPYPMIDGDIDVNAVINALANYANQNREHFDQIIARLYSSALTRLVGPPEGWASTSRVYILEKIFNSPFWRGLGNSTTFERLLQRLAKKWRYYWEMVREGLGRLSISDVEGIPDYGQGYDPDGVMIAGMGGGFGGGFGESTSYKLAFKNYLRECLRYR
jgi:hypothetical protein